MSIVVVVLAVLAGLLGTYLLSPTKGSRVVCLLVTDLLAQSVRIAARLGSTVASAAFSFATLLSPLNWVRLGLVLGTAVLVHEYPIHVLRSLDSLLVHVLRPAHAAALPVLELLRFVYGTGIGAYNFGVAVSRQLTSGTLRIVSECDSFYIGNMVVRLSRVLTATIEALLKFLEGFAVDSFDTIPITNATREVALYQETLGPCLCDSLSPVFTILFNFLRPEVLGPLVFHSTNIPVSYVQEILQLFPPFKKYPLFENTHFHAQEALRRGGEYLDDVIRLQVEFLFSVQPVRFELPPERFVGHVLASLGGAGLSAAYGTAKQLLLLPRGARAPFPDDVFKFSHLALTDLRGVLVYTIQIFPGEIEDLVDAGAALARAVLILAHAAGRATYDVFNDVRGFRATLQGYDGEWYQSFPSCQVLLETEPVNCVVGPGYDPVGKPTLQKSVAYLQESVRYLTEPLDPISRRLIRTTLSFAVETLRVGVRLLLSFDDIKAGNFFSRRIGDGWAKPFSGQLNTDKALCDVNGPGCTCNPEREPHGECDCIYRFPDVESLVRDLDFRASSSMWCNSLIFEGLLQYLLEYQVIVQDMVNLVTPGVDDNFCDSQAYRVGEMALGPETCAIEGSHNIFCNLRDAANTQQELFISLLREVVEKVVSFVDGRFELAARETVEPRLCQYERVLGSYAGLVGSLLASADDDFKERTTTVAFVALKGSTLPIKMGLAVVDAFERILTGGENPFDFLKDIVRIFLGHISELLTALGDLFDTVGTGDFFHTLAGFLDTVQEVLTDKVVEVLIFFLETTINFIEFVATGVMPEDFLEQIFEFVEKTFEILRTMVSRLWGMILTLLGPVGDAIRLLTNSICGFLEDTICEIISFVDKLPGVDFELACNLGCASFRGETGYTIQDVPRLAHALTWNSSSTCDFFIHMSKDTAFEALSPLEVATMAECLSLRLLGERLAAETKDDALKSVFYDWRQKYVILSDLGSHPQLWTYAAEKIGAVDWQFLGKKFGVALDVPPLRDQWEKLKTTRLPFKLRRVPPPAPVPVPAERKARRLYELGSMDFSSIQPTFTCAVVEEFVDMLKETTPKTIRWYEHYSDVIVPAYTDAIQTEYELSASLNVSFDDRIARDWNLLFRGDKTPAELFDAALLFISFSEDYVPFFGNSFFGYMATFECDMESVWNEESTVAERQRLVGLALWRILYMVAAFAGFSLLGVPALTLLMPAFFPAALAVYMQTVYGYSFLCFPHFPNYFLEDILEFVKRNEPNCLCVHFHTLADNCTSCDNTTTWQLPPEQGELSYLYVPLLQLKRWDVLDTLNKRPPFSYFMHQSGAVQSLVEVSDYREADAASLFILDNLIAGAAALFAVAAGVLLLPAALVALEALMLIPKVIVLIYSLCLDLE